MITVYFETKHWYAEKVATFASNDLYMACLPALEKQAEKGGFFITESEDE